jgi:hypothetical protein
MRSGQTASQSQHLASDSLHGISQGANYDGGASPYHGGGGGGGGQSYGLDNSINGQGQGQGQGQGHSNNNNNVNQESNSMGGAEYAEMSARPSYTHQNSAYMQRSFTSHTPRSSQMFTAGGQTNFVRENSGGNGDGFGRTASDGQIRYGDGGVDQSLRGGAFRANESFSQRGSFRYTSDMPVRCQCGYVCVCEFVSVCVCVCVCVYTCICIYIY